MKKILYSLIFLIVIMSFVVTGCTRSASKGGGGELPTSTSEIPFPVGPSTNPNRMTEIISSTQTAAAMTTDTVVVNTTTPETGGVSTIPTVAVDTPVPTAKSVVIVSTPTPGLPATYTLHEGEFPFCIARRFNINAGDLMALNNVSGDVAPGTTLTIPTNSVWPSEFDRALRAHPTTYVVSSGDTIYKVACLFGDVDPNALIEANGLKDPYTLTPGTTIQIP